MFIHLGIGVFFSVQFSPFLSYPRSLVVPMLLRFFFVQPCTVAEKDFEQCAVRTVQKEVQFNYVRTICMPHDVLAVKQVHQGPVQRRYSTAYTLGCE